MLMALIVVPLSSALLWLGWRSVHALEEHNVQQRMDALNIAVSSFLDSGMRTVTGVGGTLAAQPSLAAASGPAGDDERRRQLAGLVRRQPSLAAAYVGYDDGRFVYAGRVAMLSEAQRLQFGEPDPKGIIVRTISGEGAARRETFRFIAPDGSTRAGSAAQPSDFDPRRRPWYTLAMRAGGPILTEPYRFALSKEPGISVGMPIAGGGVLGFDFTLATLSSLLEDYKATTNSIVVLAAGSSDVLIQTAPCRARDPDCFGYESETRQLLRAAVAEVAARGGRIDRTVTADGRPYRLVARLLPPQLGRPFSIAAAMPVAELSEASRGLVRREAELAAASIFVAMLAAFTISLLLSRPLRSIAGKTERIRNLDFSDTTPVRSRISEILQLSAAVERLREGLEVFGHYVSKDLVTQVMRSPHSAAVGGARRDLTVMFTDIEGFSLISEDLEPELLMSRLSRYFEALGSAISGNRGMIDKYIGDSVMAFWNAPEHDPDHIADACLAALAAAAASRQLGEKWRGRGRPAFRTRIGIHTGPAVVGNVGARERINYTLVGAVANQASRLESLNKVYGTQILASGEVAGATLTRFVWRHIDRIVPAGTTEVLELYELLGSRPDDRHDGFLALWKQGQGAYGDRQFAEAMRHFEAALSLRPADGPCRVFIERCRAFAGGVAADWDGVWRFDRK